MKALVHRALVALALGCASVSVAQPAPQVAVPQSSVPQAAPTPGARPAVPPATAAPRAAPPRAATPTLVNPRRPRSFSQCNQEALRRGMRGAERRHWVARCELGYGRPLFRRRGPTLVQPSAAPDAKPVAQDGGESGSP